jgi:hypothetical protein
VFSCCCRLWAWSRQRRESQPETGTSASIADHDGLAFRGSDRAKEGEARVAAGQESARDVQQERAEVERELRKVAAERDRALEKAEAEAARKGQPVNSGSSSPRFGSNTRRSGTISSRGSRTHESSDVWLLFLIVWDARLVALAEGKPAITDERFVASELLVGVLEKAAL